MDVHSTYATIEPAILALTASFLVFVVVGFFGVSLLRIACAAFTALRWSSETPEIPLPTLSRGLLTSYLAGFVVAVVLGVSWIGALMLLEVPAGWNATFLRAFAVTMLVGVPLSVCAASYVVSESLACSYAAGLVVVLVELGIVAVVTLVCTVVGLLLT
jgi:hypothetical protein